MERLERAGWQRCGSAGRQSFKLGRRPDWLGDFRHRADVAELGAAIGWCCETRKLGRIDLSCTIGRRVECAHRCSACRRGMGCAKPAALRSRAGGFGLECRAATTGHNPCV